MNAPNTDDFLAGEATAARLLDAIHGDVAPPDALLEVLERAFAHGGGAYARGVCRRVQKELEARHDQR